MSGAGDTMATPNGSVDRHDWEALARRAASEAVDEPGVGPGLLVELLVCELAGSGYALPVDRVREIVRMRQLTRVPRTPDWLVGVITLRGEIVQVLDLRMCLGLPLGDVGRRTRIVVLHGDDGEVTGLLVDGVREVLRVPADSIAASSLAEGGAVNEMCRHGDEFVSLVDLDHVLERHGDA